MGARSDSSADTTNNNIDNRTANSGVIASGGSNVTVTTADPAIVDRALGSVDNAVNRGLDTVDRTVGRAFDFGGAALATAGAATANAIAANNANVQKTLGFASDSLDKVNATLDNGYGRMLEISDGMFKQGNALINRTQETVAEAYANAQNTAKGTIDNRTMIVLGVVAAAVIIVPLVMTKG